MEQVKLRPWSTVWRAYAGHDTFYAKQNVEPNRFEAVLVDALARWLPDSFVPPVALDPASGLMLTPDQGEVLGFEHDDVDTWCAIVEAWSVVQRALVPHADEITALGVPTIAPGDTEREVRSRAAALNALPLDDPRRLGDEARAAVDASMPDVRRAVEQVEDLGLPLTLNHNDLHGGNVFVAGTRFFDLGDALVTEPMAALLVPLGAYVDLVDCAPDDPRLWRMAEAWMQPWTDLATPRQLRAALPAAMRLARLPRHESWWRITPYLEGDVLTGFEAAGAEWLGAMPRPPLLSPAG
jgi:hypothetical protein